MRQKVNITGTIDLLNQAEARGVKRAIYVSSSGVFDGILDEPLDENTANSTVTDNLCFKSKVLAEEAIAEWLHGPRDAGPTDAGQIVVDYLNSDLPGIPPGGSRWWMWATWYDAQRCGKRPARPALRHRREAHLH